MKIPIVIRSNKILDNLSWFMKIGGITLYPYIILRSYSTVKTLNHEKIHIKQQEEMLVILFYIVYILEYFFGLFIFGSGQGAYRNISFEIEAYKNEKDFDYLDNRKRFAWVKYIFNKK